MNWGTKIAIAFSLFVGFIVYLVIRTTQVNIDLVADNYYQLELDYQAQLDKQQHLLDLGEPIALRQAGPTIEMVLPSVLLGQDHQGSVHFFRPQAKNLDVTLPLQPDAEGKMVIEKAKLLPGRYLVKVDWTTNGKGYYFEEDLFVQ